MRLCEKCKEELAESEPDDRFPFGAFTVVGGMLGGMGAAATGGLLLVPAGLIAGAMADVHRCDRCGAEEDDENPHYTPMEVEEDGTGESRFAPLQLRGSPARGWQSSHGLRSERPFSIGSEQSWGDSLLSEDEGSPEQPCNAGASTRYRYDEVTEQLVPLDIVPTEDEPEIEHEWTIGPEFDLGKAKLGLAGEEAEALPDDQLLFLDDLDDGGPDEEGWFPEEEGGL